MIETFTFGTCEVRVVLRDGDPWWVGKDVGEALGLVEYRRSLAQLDDDERDRHTMTSPSGQQEYVIISEAGLYSLILRSRRPEAKAFKRWVTHEVLPTIRRTGRYAAQQQQYKLPANYEEALSDLLDTVRQLGTANREIAELTPAAKAWEAIVGATGTYTVNTASKLLNNLDGVDVGERRLWAYLREIKWVMPKKVRRGPSAYQPALDADWLKVLGRDAHFRNGILHSSQPQVVITAKGLGELARRLTQPLGNVASIETGEPLTRVELFDRLDYRRTGESG